MTAIPRDDHKALVRRWTVLIAGVLMLSFIAQWPGPRMADWKLFTFYDPGTILKGDWLLDKGYVPTVDFGYTHGLVSLLYGRVGFAIFGRTPWTFLGLTLLTELVMAWALARIVVAAGIARVTGARVLFLIGLPLAIMPAYLTLTHPLEAMLILLALAAQAEGNKSRALAAMTVCLFVKPSMAYVYGLVLVVLIVWERRGKLSRLLWDFLPAAVALVMLAVVLATRFGWTPVVRTLLPLTGAKTYATTGFGFFSEETRRQFWLPGIEFSKEGLRLSPQDWWLYLGGPGTVYVLASIACAVGAVMGVRRVFAERGGEATRAWELLLTMGLLNTAFIFGFYGYHGSWHYYSYLPVIGGVMFLLLMTRANGGKPRNVFGVAGVAVFLSHGLLIGITIGAWLGKTPFAVPGPGAAPGLWRYKAKAGERSLYEQWRDVVAAAGTRETLIMSNGFLFTLPPTMQMPDAWFPEPGIPTGGEIERVKKQAEAADCVILFGHFTEEGVELWGSKEFAEVRKGYEVEEISGVTEFTLLRKIRPPS